MKPRVKTVEVLDYIRSHYEKSQEYEAGSN